MYESYPTASQPADLQRRAAEPPHSLLTATRLMYAGAALEVILIIVAVLSKSRLRAQIVARHPFFTAAQVHHAEAARTFPLVVGGIIAIGLWIWMAVANRRGHRWARTLSAVFFGLSTLDLIISFLLVHTLAGVIGGILIWLVGLAAIVLMFNRESEAYYREQPAAS